MHAVCGRPDAAARTVPVRCMRPRQAVARGPGKDRTKNGPSFLRCGSSGRGGRPRIRAVVFFTRDEVPESMRLYIPLPALLCTGSNNSCIRGKICPCCRPSFCGLRFTTCSASAERFRQWHWAACRYLLIPTRTFQTLCDMMLVLFGSLSRYLRAGMLRNGDKGYPEHGLRLNFRESRLFCSRLFWIRQEATR